MCDTCACAKPTRFHITPTPQLQPFQPMPVAWRRPPEAQRRTMSDDQSWNFAMDWHVMLPMQLDADDDAPPTEADLAFAEFVARVQARLDRLRAGFRRVTLR